MTELSDLFYLDPVFLLLPNKRVIVPIVHSYNACDRKLERASGGWSTRESGGGGLN